MKCIENRDDLSDTQKVANLICRLSTEICVMDEKGRKPCTMSNCRMMPIAMKAIVQASRKVNRNGSIPSHEDVRGILKSE